MKVRIPDGRRAEQLAQALIVIFLLACIVFAVWVTEATRHDDAPTQGTTAIEVILAGV